MWASTSPRQSPVSSGIQEHKDGVFQLPRAAREDVLKKFDTIFGNVLSTDQLTHQFFLATQEPKETVVAWGCRLQSIVTKINQQDAKASSYITPILASKFWDDLSNDRIKEALRPKHELKESFDVMFTSARTLEYDFSLTKPHSLVHQQSHMDFPAAVQTRASTQPVTDSHDSLFQKMEQTLNKFKAEMKKELRQFDSRLRTLEPSQSNASTDNSSFRSAAQTYDAPSASKPRRPGCTRCGYPSHSRDQCVAKRDIYGNNLN